MKSWLIAALMALLLGGCSSVDIADYRNEKPQLDLARYFDGTVDAWGVFQDRSGKVVKRFKVTIDAQWRGDVGTLDEHFEYSDGSTQRRVWTVTKLADGRYTGRADDVVGEATGEAQGNALRWRYTMALPVDGSIYHVAFDDWMFLMDDKTMLNRSFMTKFGVELGQVTLSFRKR
ncbi:DUF3833 domain-containing protein [Niveibacterium sp.]|uniref:DUF3833 domain-containing protein n=1 Tax=Niveibacterium sp. TaxID=2017444 RepID=UPI0035B1C5E6